ncbi:MAG: acetyl-CoA carboxylase biotin carboxyl carrier protein [Candidatus Omnitrophota bacterium]|jgi:acetyl-CoA carboxylase biotin carboxyl carrier protein
MNIKKIKELVDLMNENGLSEVEIEQEGVKVKLSKRAGGVVEQVIAPAPVAAAQPAGAPPAAKPAKGLSEIKAPMVGTFYRAPAPDAEPYVEIGDVVHKGDVVCIIEAMKLMNEVKSEINGKVVEISAENAEPVEYGQALFLIEPI